MAGPPSPISAVDGVDNRASDCGAELGRFCRANATDVAVGDTPGIASLDDVRAEGDFWTSPACCAFASMGRGSARKKADMRSSAPTLGAMSRSFGRCGLCALAIEGATLRAAKLEGAATSSFRVADGAATWIAL
ncbi:MAG TPA: hypothetical protein VIF40_13555 [Methylosinus sp.]|uniref:hypothetical protein n=1 Tax=Methylosinus sp. TaxID=427 RepID=UPI002F921C49